MTAPAPGQAAYERWHSFQRRRFPGIAPILWDELGAEAQGEWESVAQDAIETAESHSTIYLNEIDRLATALRTIRDAHAPGEPGFDVARRTLDDASRVIGTRPVPQPAPDPRMVALDPALVHKELRELIQAHEQTLEEILKNADAEPDMSDTREDYAVRYVRRLEAEAEAERFAVALRSIANRTQGCDPGTNEREVHLLAFSALHPAEEREGGEPVKFEEWSWTLMTTAHESAVVLARDGEDRLTIPLDADQTELLLGHPHTLASAMEGFPGIASGSTEEGDPAS